MPDIENLERADPLEIAMTLGSRIANRVDDLVVELESLAEKETARRRLASLGLKVCSKSDAEASTRADDLVAALREIDQALGRLTRESKSL